MNVLLLSTYELGHQPLNLARPAAHLLAAGHAVECLDLSVQGLDEGLVRRAQLVGISVPMHTATRLGVRVAERVRSLNAGCHISFYGLYAGLHADLLLEGPADSVIGGEFETPLVELAEALARGDAFRPAVTFLDRQPFQAPARALLPPLERYARVEEGGIEKLAGYVEASRGCAHQCLHCPITPVYKGRLRIVPQEVVLEDIRRLVEMGAEHITFGDPDFFNGIRHSLRVIEAMHRAFPRLTFDATIKVEHLLEHRHHLEALRAAGCLFIVSAAEAVHDHILAHLRKGHRAADIETALRLTAAAGIALRLTFVPFTPWTTRQNYLELLDFLGERGLIYHVEPVQLAIRLLLPQGSSLLADADLAGVLGGFDRAALSHRWLHPDPGMDALQREVQAVVEAGAGCGADTVEVFASVYRLAQAAVAEQSAGRFTGKDDWLSSHAAPRLTEPWFC